MNPTAPVGVVLCGGRSSRMGSDKALLGDPPWAHRVAAALAGAGCHRVLCVGGDPAAAPDDATHIADRRPGDGPLAALASAVEHLRSDGTTSDAGALVVAACDLPLLDAADVTTLLELVSDPASGTAEHPGAVEAEEPSPDHPPGVVAVYLVDDRPQWSLVALDAAAAGTAVRLVDGGRRAMAALADSGASLRSAAPPVPARLVDVDHPDEAADHLAGPPSGSGATGSDR